VDSSASRIKCRSECEGTDSSFLIFNSIAGRQPSGTMEERYVGMSTEVERRGDW